MSLHVESTFLWDRVSKQPVPVHNSLCLWFLHSGQKFKSRPKFTLHLTWIKNFNLTFSNLLSNRVHQSSTRTQTLQEVRLRPLLSQSTQGNGGIHWPCGWGSRPQTYSSMSFCLPCSWMQQFGSPSSISGRWNLPPFSLVRSYTQSVVRDYLLCTLKNLGWEIQPDNLSYLTLNFIFQEKYHTSTRMALLSCRCCSTSSLLRCSWCWPVCSSCYLCCCTSLTWDTTAGIGSMQLCLLLWRPVQML